ncbi:hypothetical protein DYB32_001443 [Aphanomyces invadans]|uniref:Uncharacterized protein n=1 Tax=Aphanomyces invadans TaxID=157072 RepID=A0A3R6W2N1_9STRA|nr:hypothetical protein DYB32_001443 [Aphanomyces invadans]
MTLSHAPPTGRLDRFLNSVLSRLVHHDVLDQIPVKSIMKTLVLDGLPVTDRDLWGILRQTPALTKISLVGCPNVTFHLFPICQSLQSTLSLEQVDLYLTFVQHASMMTVHNKFQKVVAFTPSGLVPLSHEITRAMITQYTVDSWSNRIRFLDKDQLVEDHPTMCPEELGAWPFSSLPVFESHTLSFSGSAYLTPLASSPAAYTFKSFAHASRFVYELYHPSCLATKLRSMTMSVTKSILPRPKPIDPLDVQAQQVLASLHAWKVSLQDQVDELTVAVDRAKHEHHVALADYNHAERQRQEVEKAANRAVLALSLGQPSDAIAALGATLEMNQFAVLDAFLGHAMAFALFETLDNLHTYGGPYSFERGVLAGGKTGRNLRYQKPSVRGDDVLWLDGTEPECPPIVSQTLRQLDRLIIERLATDELTA